MYCYGNICMNYVLNGDTLIRILKVKLNHLKLIFQYQKSFISFVFLINTNSFCLEKIIKVRLALKE